MGAGQFCTNPGLLLAIEGEGLDAFIATATGGVAQAPAQVMLTKGIGAAFAMARPLWRAPMVSNNWPRANRARAPLAARSCSRPRRRHSLPIRHWRMKCLARLLSSYAAPMRRN
jgi:hypothetical protein